MYKGRIRLGDFYQTASSAGALDFVVDLDNLISIATDVLAMQDGFELTSAVVNDYVITHNAFRDKFTSTQTGLSGFNLGSEIIEYVVLQTPGKNITSGASMPFTMIAEVMSNVVVYPSVNNVLLYKTFQPIWMGKEDKLFDGVDYHGSIHGCLAPTTKAQVAEFIRALPEQAISQEGASNSVSPLELSLSPPTKEILLYHAIKRMKPSDVYDVLDELDESKEQDVLGNPALIASSLASGLKILYDNRKLIKDVGTSAYGLIKKSKKGKKAINKIQNNTAVKAINKARKGLAGRVISTGVSEAYKELQRVLSKTKKGTAAHEEARQALRDLGSQPN